MFSADYSQSQLADRLTLPEARTVWEVSDAASLRYVRVSANARPLGTDPVGYCESASGERTREFWLSPDSDPYPGVGTPTEAADPRTLAPNEPGRQTLRSWYGPEVCRAAGVTDDSLPAEDAPAELVRYLMAERWQDDEDCDDFQWMSSAELDAGDFTLAYHIDGMLVEGQPCILAGPKKSLKTSLLIDLTISLASETMFLQRFPVNRQYKTGIMSGESGKSTIQETARRVCRAKGLNLKDVRGVRWCFDLPEFGGTADVEKLQRFIAGLDVVMIDPAYLCLPLGDDAGNLFKVGRLLRSVTQLCDDAGCTLLIAHHARNRRHHQSAFDPPELDDIAWAGFQEWARQWLLLGRREKYEPSKGGSHKLWLSAGGSAGHSGLWGLDIEEGVNSDQGGRRWDVDVVNASEAVADSVDRRERKKEDQKAGQLLSDIRKVQAVLTSVPEGETKRNISAVSGVEFARCDKAINELLSCEIIEPCKVTKSNRQTYDGFKVTAIHCDSLRLNSA